MTRRGQDGARPEGRSASRRVPPRRTARAGQRRGLMRAAAPNPRREGGAGLDRGGQATSQPTVGEAVGPSWATWIVLAVGASLFVLVVSAAGDYARRLVSDSLSKDSANVTALSSRLTSVRLPDGGYRVRVFLIVRNKDAKHDAESVRVSAHISDASAPVGTLTTTVQRILANQTTALIISARRSYPVALTSVFFSVGNWVPQYPWSQNASAALSITNSLESKAVVARVTNSSGTFFRGGKLVALAMDPAGGILGGAEAPIPPLQATQAATIRLPRDGVLTDQRRELYVQLY